MERYIYYFIVLGFATIIGYYSGYLARKLKLPSIIGYMLLGVLTGSSVAELLKPHDLEILGFVTELTLGFVAFMIGAELNIKSLKRQGGGIVAIIFAESLTAFALVAVAVYVVTRDVPLALVFGAMAPASAPAGTVAVIQEFRARGPLTKALYAVVGFDDGLAVIIFGFAAAFAKMLLAAEAGEASASALMSLVDPLREIGLSLLVGSALGSLFSIFVSRIPNEHESYILVYGFVLLGCGLSLALHLSLILTNMVIGFVLANTHRERDIQSIGRQLQSSVPFLYILFFFFAGAHLHVQALPSLGLVGIVYILFRSTGLILGSRAGAFIGGVKGVVQKYVGLGILSQAGVAIGLSLIIRREFLEIGTEHADRISMTVLTTITATCIFFELVGPILTKVALEKAGEIHKNDLD